jgi:hypothetical protein
MEVDQGQNRGYSAKERKKKKKKERQDYLENFNVKSQVWTLLDVDERDTTNLIQFDVLLAVAITAFYYWDRPTFLRNISIFIFRVEGFLHHLQRCIECNGLLICNDM